MKCTNCLKSLTDKKARKKFYLTVDEDFKIAESIFSKTLIDSNSPFCKTCRQKVAKKKFNAKEQIDLNSTLTNSSSTLSLSTQSSPTHSTSDFEVSNEYNMPKNEVNIETIELNIPCSTSSQQYCIVCKSKENRNRIPKLVRFNAFTLDKLYIPKDVRCCKEHYLNSKIYNYCIKKITLVSNVSIIPVDELKWLLNESVFRLSKSTILQSFSDETISDQDCLAITGLQKIDFFDLVKKFKSLKNSKNRTVSEAVAIFLTKLKTNLSHEVISKFLSFNNSQLIGHICDEVQNAFEQDILPKYIGTESLKRDVLLSRQSDVARHLMHGSELILIADGTYAYHQKSKNNWYQRKSFSVQKNTHLVKPFTICTSDGFIVDFFGPYFGSSNDSSILNEIMQNNDQFTSLLKVNDCFVLDRGFRDSVNMLKTKGYHVKMPAFKGQKRKQISCEESNNSRIVTKVRWVVEAVHGIIKQKWSYLRTDIKNQTLVKIGTYFRIAGSLHNLYGKRLLSDQEMKDHVIEKMTGNIPKENKLHDYIEEKKTPPKANNF